MQMNMEKKFNIELCSDLDYEEMVADIYFENSSIAMVTQENGEDKMEIEMFSPNDDSSWKLPLDEFIKILQSAKKNLIEFKKIK